MQRIISKPRTDGVSVGRQAPVLLTDGGVTLRLPNSDDVLRVARYGADENLLEGTWIAGPFPSSDISVWASKVISDALASWTDAGGTHGGGLIIDESQPFVGILYLTPQDDNALEVSYGVSPPARGRGIATRALRLITDWALTRGGFTRVELRIAESHAASQRVAQKAGFRLRGRFEVYIEQTGETYVDLLYSRVSDGGRQNNTHNTLEQRQALP